MQRRTFLATSVGAALCANIRLAAGEKQPNILLRSSWQTVNIGDIAHTPGVLALLEKYLPEANVTLWASDVRNGVRELLEKRFPKLKIVQRGKELDQTLSSYDFLLHGSGPSLVAQKDVQRWKDETGKPYGVFGITVSSVSEDLKKLLSSAEFVFFRDSVSLKYCREQSVNCPVMEFGPDGAFAVDIENEKAAREFLQAHQLEPGQFLCCIPRLRYTPYWKIKNRPFDAERHQRNEEMKAQDHAPLIEAIQAVVTQTDKKVLLCPEDMSQMEVGKDNIYDKLTPEIRKRVVWRENYWLTDEAISTYRLSAGLFGMEMHSPIMCIGNGIPAIVCRFAEQTSKGFMWNDIGLNDWLFNMDVEADRNRVAETVLAVAKKPALAKEKAEAARERVSKLQQGMVNQLKSSLVN
ncbi:polysaccharide pyruvyl transferase family protein [Rubinisphaera italica]|uniref:Polysaccharide pyruvyl transferase n=1 Tax=Rubinisphaera italica TaxID=2527969 RepID=A0A5C5XKN9_9PLAN|nr:polysaccharide pyruvyl transferase family protein [Rubinisphaera italica]TWT63500.1 Polysaccharide pyruvyl transferase [Rubinisphaera italica]